MTPRLTVCGLGPGGQGQLTAETEQALAGASTCYLRTERHPTADRAPAGSPTFDALYEQADSFDQVYAAIADALVEAATATEGVVYAVPGSPLVLESTVRRLRADPRIELDVLPALSFLDLVWARLGVDPVDDGVRLVDGHRFAVEAAGERGPLLVAHTHASHVLSDIKLVVDAGPEQRAVVLQRLGTPEERIVDVGWPDLDRLVDPDHLTCLYLPEVTAPVAQELMRSVELMHRLRQDCPWDADQTHRSLRPYLLEETHELLEAIDGLDRVAGLDADGPSPEGRAYEELEEELGDVWFQVLFHTELATEAGQFTIADVARTLHDKLVSRHPHVFDQRAVSSTEEIESNWDEIKRAEKGRESALDGIPGSLPALSLAAKTLHRAGRAGAPVELAPQARSLAEAMASITSEPELGLALLAVVDACRQRGFDAEAALRTTVGAAAARFRREEAAGSVTAAWVQG